MILNVLALQNRYSCPRLYLIKGYEVTPFRSSSIMPWTPDRWLSHHDTRCRSEILEHGPVMLVGHGDCLL